MSNQNTSATPPREVAEVHFAYFARYYDLPGADPEGTCTMGCHTEPSCITDEPRKGWPSHPELRGGQRKP